MKKLEKVLLVENLSSELKETGSLVVVNYSGLSVKSQQELKKRLAAVGAKMIVVKNTLLKRAGEAAKLNKEVISDSVLCGQTAIIVSSGKDPFAFIQVLGKFAKEFEVPKMKVGVLDGIFRDEATLTKIAFLPGKEEFLARVLASLTSPQYGLVGVLEANLQKLVLVLKKKAG